MRKEGAQERYLKLVDEVIARGPFSAEWDSLAKAKLPEWFNEKRLGIFLHWGVYSVPAYANEWYPRGMYIQGTDEFEHHVRTYGSHERFGYKDFIPMFRAERFDASEWIRLFRAAGAGYLFPVGEHHDGFQMYESELSDWNAADKGPCRDVLGELRSAAEEAGMYFCTSSHRAEHWFFMSHGKEFESDIKEPLRQGDFYWPAMPEREPENWHSTPAPTEEYLLDWLSRTAEIIVKYRPRLLYFDWWIQHEAFAPYLKKLAAFYYNMGKSWGQDVMICYKYDAMAFGSGIVEMERGGFEMPKPYRWQTDTAVARNSWCYTDSLDYKTSRDLIITLIDTVSKNGNLLLNIGPKADGTIPEKDCLILQDFGKWMSVNSEAIDGTRPWKVSLEGTGNIRQGAFQENAEVNYTSGDFRFTARDGVVYAICLACPEDGSFCIRSFASKTDLNDVGKAAAPFRGILRRVSVLGYDGNVEWKTDPEGLLVRAPGLYSEFPVVVKLEV